MDNIVKHESVNTDVMPKPVLALHWFSALAIALVLALIWLRILVDEDNPLHATLLGMHRQLGLLVLLLWATRLAVRWHQRHRLPREPLPAPLRLAAGAAHLALYALLCAIPLLGWSMTGARGQAVTLPGSLALPALVGADPDLADTLQDWHQWAAWTLLAMVAMHVLAALWHHWVRRDGVLASMLPLVRRRTRR